MIWHVSSVNPRRYPRISASKGGVVLLSVVIILLTIALIGASLAAFFSAVNAAARTTADEAKAFYLAEAGIARAVSLLRNEADAAMKFNEVIGPFTLGEGSYSIRLDLVQSLIISTGEVGNSKVTLQLQYSAL
jgi:Tfp pilus assembly protein PilX